MADVLSHVFVYTALAGYVVGGVWLALTRRKMRATFLVDSILRTIVPLAVIQLILVYVEVRAATHEHPFGWTVITGIFAGLALYMLWPIFFLTRSGASGDGYVLFSRSMLGGLHTKLEELYGPGPARVIAYGIGRAAGEKDTRAALGSSRLPPRAWWTAMPYVFRSTGLGALKLDHVDSGKEVRFTITDGFEVFHGHESGIPGCDLTRGYFAGLGKALYPHLECHVEETRCAQAEGGHKCEFTVRWFEPVAMPREAAVAAQGGA